MRAFADTNIAVYAESDDGEKSKQARAIIESSPVISAQVVNEVIAPYRFTPDNCRGEFQRKGAKEQE